MKVTTYEAIIEQGQVRLPADVRLPEKPECMSLCQMLKFSRSHMSVARV